MNKILLIFSFIISINKIVNAGSESYQSVCGTFIPYDPISQPNLPKTHGVLIGTFMDARLSIADSNPGAYVICDKNEIYNPGSSAYLENNLNLSWVAVDLTSYNVPNAIGLKNNTIFIRRAVVELDNGSTFMTIIDIIQSPNGLVVDYSLPSDGSFDPTNMEVLVCK
ncbi:hypothetical protein PVAND_015865 [Polypedilum vanderplanki]|uniref:Uncharacterized protein n=1 Tax=Polypedilum vanderplanki TaxID=319348 RepID=A0A9J6BDH0_POLVA|nr:hypothetical protein PVAND_015865 [Polypedilum vanderplanki]